MGGGGGEDKQLGARIDGAQWSNSEPRAQATLPCQQSGARGQMKRQTDKQSGKGKAYGQTVLTSYMHTSIVQISVCLHLYMYLMYYVIWARQVWVWVQNAQSQKSKGKKLEEKLKKTYFDAVFMKDGIKL